MSNLRPTKRIDLLLQVIAKLDKREKIRLLILAGASFDPYDALLDEFDLRGSVIIRSGAELIENYLEAADAVVSTSEVESFGLSILEAMFFGKPVLAFEIGGIPEVLDGAGLLFPFGDVASMAAALDRVARSPEFAWEIGQRCRARAESKFTEAQVVPRYEDLYYRTSFARYHS